MKRHLLRLLDILAIATLIGTVCVVMSGCFAIPVRAVPSDEPILVAPVGIETPLEDGTVALNTHLPQPDPAKFPSAASTTAGWGNVLTLIISLLTGAGGIGGTIAILLPKLRGLSSVAKIACELADKNAAAETDEEVAVNKSLALARQREAGVVNLTRKVRGK